MTSDLDRKSRSRLGRALGLTRAVMIWEQTAAIWAPLLIAAAAVAVAGLWGAFDLVPGWAHDGVLALALLFALVFAVRGALGLRWPSREEARRRLELDSRLVHAPLSSLEDAPAAGDADLWALHRARAVEAIGQVRLGRPRAGLAAADPFALRYLLLVAAALALWSRGTERAPQALAAFQPVVRFAAVPTDGAAKAASAIGDLFGRPDQP